MMNGGGDMEYQRERQEEMEAEKVRQQRIRDKVPGRRVNGNARAGDIDGMCYLPVFDITSGFPFHGGRGRGRTNALLTEYFSRFRPGQGRVGVRH
jgi:hypothetical protein